MFCLSLFLCNITASAMKSFYFTFSIYVSSIHPSTLQSYNIYIYIHILKNVMPCLIRFIFIFIITLYKCIALNPNEYSTKIKKSHIWTQSSVPSHPVHSTSLQLDRAIDACALRTCIVYEWVGTLPTLTYIYFLIRCYLCNRYV